MPSGDTYLNASHPDGTWENTTLWPRNNWDSAVSSDGTVSSYASGGVPRFPTQTSVPSSTSLKLPGAPQVGLGFSRTAVLANLNDPFSVVGLTNMMSFTGQAWAWTDVYDGTNRLWRTTSPEGRQTVTGLDAQGRLIHYQTAGQTPLDVSYDAQGRVRQMDDTASVGLRRTIFSYDSLGRLRTLTDPLGQTNQYTYDGAGRLQQLTLTDGQVANFQSDAEFNLTSVTPPGRPAHRFEYNAVGLVTNYVPPVVDALDESVHFAHDADRNLTRVALPDGQNVLFTRGPGGRIDQVILGSGPTLTYSYGSNNGLPTNIVSTTGDSLRFDYAVSKVTNITHSWILTDNVSAVTNVFDVQNAQGSLVTNTSWSGTVTGSVGIIYNANLLPASRSVNGAAIAYSYDRDLLLTKAGNLTLTNDPQSGLVMGTSLGIVTDQRQFDDRGLLTNYVARVSGTSVWSLTLAYDFVDRLTNRVETVGGTTRTFGYAYDVAGRLQQVWQNGALAATYSYDANGNRLTRNAESATYDAQDRVLTYAGSTFGWSRNGDLRTRTSGGQTTTYTYDVRGALTRVVRPLASPSTTSTMPPDAASPKRSRAHSSAAGSGTRTSRLPSWMATQSSRCASSMRPTMRPLRILSKVGTPTDCSPTNAAVFGWSSTWRMVPWRNNWITMSSGVSCATRHRGSNPLAMRAAFLMQKRACCVLAFATMRRKRASGPPAIRFCSKACSIRSTPSPATTRSTSPILSAPANVRFEQSRRMKPSTRRWIRWKERRRRSLKRQNKSTESRLPI